MQEIPLGDVKSMNTTDFEDLPSTVRLDVSGINLHNGRLLLFVFTAIMLISMFLNSGVMAACFYRRFNSPMLLYIALASIADTSWGIVGISSLVNSVIVSRKEISFSECLLQLFCLHFSNFQQSLTMLLMYVDRHWAIFHPYSYLALITNKGGALKLAIIVWTIGLMLSISFVAVVTKLVFCNITVVIPDAICAISTVVKSSCGNSDFPNMYSISVLYLVFGMMGFTAMYSTWCIIRKCRKSTEEANIKALHTCFTQLFVCLAQFSSLVIITVFTRFVKNPRVGFLMELIGVTTPAFINPLIFGFRIQEVRLSLLIIYQKLRLTGKKGHKMSEPPLFLVSGSRRFV
uniref:G-protein coupled receptors family 1 profile domain-containing protein n=1 Tax=Eptatretus burgeri TaxID=7764 RepID=A0A8C4WTC1_EPTBU